MPYYPPQAALRRGIDLAFGKKQITASVTSALLQGKSIDGISTDLQKRISTMGASSAVRTARTAVTAAQNGGRQDTYTSAKAMGIELKKEWLASLDARTRPAHGAADGQQVDVDEPFIVDGYKMMFPGDKSAPAYLVYNCRCTTVAAIDGVTDRGQRRGRVNGTGKYTVTDYRTYTQWMQGKSAGGKENGNSSEPVFVGMVDYNNEKEVLSKLGAVARASDGLSYEINCTITSDGKVWYVKGSKGFVNPSTIPSSLVGSYSYHNHPPDITHYSFCDDDIVFFLISGEKYSAASDDLFEYSLERTADTISITPEKLYARWNEIRNGEVTRMQFLEEIDPDIDTAHSIVEILARELNIKYERKSR